jgi:hypothetical protein
VAQPGKQHTIHISREGGSLQYVVKGFANEVMFTRREDALRYAERLVADRQRVGSTLKPVVLHAGGLSTANPAALALKPKPYRQTPA